MLDQLIETVIKEDASDLHLSEGRRPVIRVSEELIPLADKEPVSSDQIREILNALISPESKDIFKTKRQIDFSYDYKGKARFRGNAYVSQKKISIALRNIPSAIKTLEDLNLPDTLRIFAERKQGFFLVVGPTGNGKTTTLASLIEMINQNRLERIITIEDPIEYVFQPKKSMIDQREVRIDTPNFPMALEGLFRQDVDVVMIGEMRTAETMATAVTAAETGHLVFSTLHTNNAAQTIDRIIDSFPANQQDQIRLQLAGSLAGIFSMRLVPRTSGGLIPAYELLIANNAVANLIREGRTHEINTVIETGSGEGMIDLNRSLASLVQSGDITVENAYLYSLNQKVLEKMI